VHFTRPEEFEKTMYARQKLNHPVLLALRFVRQLAMNYYQEHGSDYPDKAKLLKIDPPRARPSREPSSLPSTPTRSPVSQKPKFTTWLNAAVRRRFALT